MNNHIFFYTVTLLAIFNRNPIFKIVSRIEKHSYKFIFARKERKYAWINYEGYVLLEEEFENIF